MEVLLWKCATKFLAEISPGSNRLGHLDFENPLWTHGKCYEWLTKSCFEVGVYVVLHQMVETSRTCLRPYFQMRRRYSHSENGLLGELTALSEPFVALT